MQDTLTQQGTVLFIPHGGGPMPLLGDKSLIKKPTAILTPKPTLTLTWAKHWMCYSRKIFWLWVQGLLFITWKNLGGTKDAMLKMKPLKHGSLIRVPTKAPQWNKKRAFSHNGKTPHLRATANQEKSIYYRYTCVWVQALQLLSLFLKKKSLAKKPVPSFGLKLSNSTITG